MKRPINDTAIKPLVRSVGLTEISYHLPSISHHGPELMEFIMQKSGAKPVYVLRQVPTLPQVPR
jgi:hypothetical protein